MPARAGALGAAAAAFIALAVGLPSAASGTETEVVPARVEAASWHIPFPGGDGPALRGRTISISISSGYCVGKPKPRFDHLKLVERPKTKQRPYKSSVITIFMRRPPFEAPVTPPNTNEDVYDTCFGIGLEFEKRIKLKRPAADLRFFDGSDSPPRPVPLPR